MKFRILASAAVACAVSAFAAQSATLTIDGTGQLTGATGVDVGGTLYDVTFADGSCETLYNQCDPDGFLFKTNTDAAEASAALLEQVFVDGIAGDFDTDPTLTKFIEPPFDFAIVYTPFDLDPFAFADVFVSIAQNTISEATDVVTQGALVSTDALSNSPFETYAIWSLSSTVTPVPLPAGLPMLAGGLLVLGLLRKRAR